MNQHKDWDFVILASYLIYIYMDQFLIYSIQTYQEQMGKPHISADNVLTAKLSNCFQDPT